MTFKHEYIITDQEMKLHYVEELKRNRKEQCEYVMSKKMGEVFGWEEKGQTALAATSTINHHHRLEIEAFPMDKWIAFKQMLFSKFIDDDYEGAGLILELIKGLESFGKPAGEAKGQLP